MSDAWTLLYNSSTIQLGDAWEHLQAPQLGNPYSSLVSDFELSIDIPEYSLETDLPDYYVECNIPEFYVEVDANTLDFETNQPNYQIEVNI